MDIRNDTMVEDPMKSPKHENRHNDQEQQMAAKENQQNQDQNMLSDSGSGLSGDTANADRSSRGSSEGTSGGSLAASYASSADMSPYDGGVKAKSARDDSEMVIDERKDNTPPDQSQDKSSLSLLKQSKQSKPADKKSSNKNLPKKYFCRVCNQGFTRKHNMVSHELIHSESKPHVCTACDLKFRRIHDLRRHEKLHTGEKPFICKKCKRSFARPDALTRHQNSPNACSGSSANKSGSSGSATAVSSSSSSNESDGSNNNVPSSMSITDIINRDNFDGGNRKEYGYKFPEQSRFNEVVPRRREMPQYQNRENMYYDANSPYHHNSEQHSSPQNHLVPRGNDPVNNSRHQTYQTIQNKPYNTTITTTTTTTTTTNRRNFNLENEHGQYNNSDGEHREYQGNRSSFCGSNSEDESFGRRRLNEGKYVTMERYQDLVSYTQDLKESLKSMSSRLQFLESESNGKPQSEHNEN